MSAAFAVDWLEMLVRWLHLITGIAWIGASFYFVWLDNHLRPAGADAAAARGLHGDLWSVHGGGFYHNEKFLAGPADQPLPDDLHWFKWEAYWTWLSGMGLLGLVYWYGASAYLIDPRVAALTPALGIALSAGLIVAAWVVYDLLCRWIRHELVLGLLVALLVLAIDLTAFALFSARAAYILVGASVGTIMVANVYFIIIPGQKKMLAAIRAGQPPDPRPGLQGKQRSVHNTYFTLPLLLIMITSHYPATWQHPHGAWVLVGLSAAGVLIRQYFVARHSGRASALLLVAAVILLSGLAWWVAPPGLKADPARADVSLAQVIPVIETHCTGCHSARPTDTIFTIAPLGIMLDSPAQIEAAAQRIFERTVITRDMPFNNLTNMTDAERALVAAWYNANHQ